MFIGLRESMGERAIDRLHPYWGSNLWPRCVSWLGTELTTFRCTRRCPNQLSRSGLESALFKSISVRCPIYVVLGRRVSLLERVWKQVLPVRGNASAWLLRLTSVSTRGRPQRQAAECVPALLVWCNHSELPSAGTEATGMAAGFRHFSLVFQCFSGTICFPSSGNWHFVAFPFQKMYWWN